MISTPKLGPGSRIESGFPSLTCGFTGSLPSLAEHRRDLRLPIVLPQRWGTDIASYPGREAITPPLASLSGISTRRRPRPHSLSIPFILVRVGVGDCGVTARVHAESSASSPHAHLGWYPDYGALAFTLFPLMRHQGTCSRSPDAFTPHRVLTRLKVAEKTIPKRALGKPTAREKPVYRAPLTAILTATAQLLAESFWLLPLVVIH